MMAIDPDSAIEASDFIDVSERDATPANDAGRVPKLESDGFLDPVFLKDVSARVRIASDYQFPSVDTDLSIPWDTEDFDTQIIHSLTGETTMYNENGDDSEQVSTGSSDWFAQEFTTGANDNILTRVVAYFRHSSAGSSSYKIHLRSSLTGSNLFSTGTISFAPVGTATTQTTEYMSWNLSPSTTYYIVIEVITANGSYFAWREETGTGTGGWISTDSGVSWSTSGAGDGFRASFYTDDSSYFKIPEDGKYLISFNYETGEAGSKTIKFWQNSTVFFESLTQPSSADNGMGTFSTLYEFSANDTLTITLAVSSSASDDVKANGSTFEIIRLR